LVAATKKARKTKSASARAALAKNMVLLRRARGYSQEALAFEAGLHRTFIAHCERQARNIALDNLERIASALGVEPYVLLLPDDEETSVRHFA